MAFKIQLFFSSGNKADTLQHHFDERLVFAWYGMMGWSEGSREREDWMSEVKDNIRPGVEIAGSRSARCEKCGLGKLVEG